MSATGVPRGRGRTPLLGALLVDSVGSGLYVPLSLIYFVELAGVPQTTLGVLVSVAGVVTFPLPVLVGYLADRFGAFPLVIGSHALQAVGFLGYGAATGAWSVLLVVTLVTAGVRVFWSVVFTAVADFADGSGSAVGKDQWFAWVSTFRLVGFGIGVLISGVALSAGTSSAYLLVSNGAAGCYALSALALALFVRVPRRAGVADGGPTGYGGVLRDRRFLGFTALNTVFALTGRMLALGLPTAVLYLLHRPGWLASAALLGNAVLLALCTAPVTALVRRWRRARVVALAGALWAGWGVLFAFLSPGQPDWLVVALVGGGTLLFTVAGALHGPSSTALVHDLAPPAARGRYLAAFQYSFAASGIVAPVFFTALFDVAPALPWLALGLLNLGAVVGARVVGRAAEPASR
ncbi:MULTISPECIES: MFS transporter [Actinosynnema]|uniref:MFS transporter n=1 Tax=Actinosynnema TaxID=40566 RepID=UPI0020A2F522|nr:MFS transporter [Actinosynnema pretiosum]MCP2097752.1 Major Facilitator Superfamily protein [Actinosynnema pretiosum]